MTDVATRRQARPVVFLLAAAGAFLASWYAGTAMTPGPPGADEKAACWVLADMDSFFCGPCLEHLLAFFKAVPARIQEDRVRGILVFGAGRTPEDTRRRADIVRTKWQGFSRSNGIRVPASVDADGAFAGLARAGVGVIVFDPRAGAVRRYALPVPARALEEIVRILIN